MPFCRDARSRFKSTGASIALAVAILSSGGAVADACNVPVFRYALERWRPDPYRLTIVHRGPLSNADRSLIELLNEQVGASKSNLVVRTFDTSEQDEPDGGTRVLRADLPLPALVLQYSEHLQLDSPIWTSPLNAKSVERLFGSPNRTELVRRLADGQTAVWLLLECGQSDRDEQAAALLRQELKRLERELKLPELTDSPEDKLLAGPPLQVAFSVLRVARSDAEQPLVRMLLNCESDLPDRTDPMVFPVFGRGRALLPLIGAGVTAENIQSSAAFLVGACSCEVKGLNPGFDLLLSANWDELLTVDGMQLTAAPTRQRTPPAEAELVPIPAGSSEAAPAQPNATPNAVTVTKVVNVRLMIVSAVGLTIIALLAISAWIGRPSRGE